MQEPDYFKHIAPNAWLNAKELAKALDMPLSTVWLHIKLGKLPPPDSVHLVGKTLHRPTYINKPLWRISTVKKLIKERV
jgi:hypothetical protein